MQAYLDAIRKSISKDRFDSYRRSGDKDDLDVLARHFWNAMLCETLYPAMHAFEVALRNSLYTGIESVYPATRADCENVRSWLDFKTPIIHPNEVPRVRDAKFELSRHSKQLTPGRLVAELNLNFWRKLLHKPYGEKSAGAEAIFGHASFRSYFPVSTGSSATSAGSRGGWTRSTRCGTGCSTRSRSSTRSW